MKLVPPSTSFFKVMYVRFHSFFSLSSIVLMMLHSHVQSPCAMVAPQPVLSMHADALLAHITLTFSSRTLPTTGLVVINTSLEVMNTGLEVMSTGLEMMSTGLEVTSKEIHCRGCIPASMPGLVLRGASGTFTRQASGPGVGSSNTNRVSKICRQCYTCCTLPHHNRPLAPSLISKCLRNPIATDLSTSAFFPAGVQSGFQSAEGRIFADKVRPGCGAPSIAVC